MSEKIGDVPKHTYGSNYRRNRKETKFDALEMANELKHKVSKYVMNENYVPKRWRYINGKPAVDYAREIRDNISFANDIRLEGPDIKQMQEKRNAYQQKALSFCNILGSQLSDIISECAGATDENMREITDLLDKLIGKIINWIKSDSNRSGQ